MPRLVATALCCLLLALPPCASARVPAAASAAPAPLVLWRFQEATGAARVSSGAGARYNYSLVDGDPAAPIARDASGGGVFGPFAARFRGTAATVAERLFAARADVPALTVQLAGPAATVSMVAWVRRPANASGGAADYFAGMLAGVWGDSALRARQYAMYFDLGACHAAPTYANGFAAHVSATGGATPGHEWCVSAACDPRPLPADAWHCVAHVYDGRDIRAYVNASLVDNGYANPYDYPGGIFSPEAHGMPGAEFGVGRSVVPGVNQFGGLLGGLAVFDAALSQAQVDEVCAWPDGWRR